MTTDDDSATGGEELALGKLPLQGILEKAREVQSGILAAKEAGKRMRVRGSAGGGMVVCEADGHGTLIRVGIEPGLFGSGDREMVEDLVVAAVNQAQRLAREAMQVELAKAAGGLPLPAMDLSKLL